MTALEGAFDNKIESECDKNKKKSNDDEIYPSYRHLNPSLIDQKNTNASPRAITPSQPSLFPPNCYYCGFKQHETKAEYDNHVVMRHSGKPGYPGPADIKALNLKPQNMKWELQGI
jgi:hypothetical protein